MPKVLILGPERIADATGTHNPGDVLDNPTDELLKLAEDGTLNPDTNKPYCKVVTDKEATAARSGEMKFPVKSIGLAPPPSEVR